ncbi:M28 family peptidase [Pyxidicoccus fallax]|uniref:M28 family peptidase n=1 Tax=Pyxidicoccus fallax TaxID=394095 RepID=A0A848LHK2_9BACT|nr:M28 family peptidase [Pyxidicoccus fallax]NMO16761.1 M28 family peptidase [Pyxidicoccus fallax]NPC77846.1 M28 family peptidase [Pyxidicoccus fallax]
MDRLETWEPGSTSRTGIAVQPEALREDVMALAVDIGERNLRDTLRARRLGLTRDYLVQRLESAGYAVKLHGYEAGGHRVENVEAELPGTSYPDEVLVVGAHYDSAHGSPGANDNGSAVASLLALAGLFQVGAMPRPARTVRFVAFATEEQPFTRTPEMGSFAYARRCRERHEDIRAMLSLETLGSYAHAHRWPEGPFPLNLYSPLRGDFFAVVGNLASRALVRRCVAAFPQGPGARCAGVALPGLLPGVKSSDHWSFWQHGYPAVMLTDTGPLRYRHYHRHSDILDRVDFTTLATVTTGLVSVVRELATGEPV